MVGGTDRKVQPMFKSVFAACWVYDLQTIVLNLSLISFSPISKVGTATLIGMRGGQLQKDLDLTVSLLSVSDSWVPLVSPLPGNNLRSSLACKVYDGQTQWADMRWQEAGKKHPVWGRYEAAWNINQTTKFTTAEVIICKHKTMGNNENKDSVRGQLITGVSLEQVWILS